MSKSNAEERSFPFSAGSLLKAAKCLKSSLLDFILGQFDICDFPDAEPFVERILKNGKGLLLLDGLDEVSTEKTDKIIKNIRDFSNKYSDNQFNKH